MIPTDHFQKVEVTSHAELRLWLEQNHPQEESVWLVTFLKAVPEKYLSAAEVLDKLICFGWIDGIRRKLDEHRTMQPISSRSVQHWAKSYKDRAAKLIEMEKMHEAGFRSIEHSKQVGLWDFMADVDRLDVPQDLQDGLDKVPGASDFFHRINDSSKRFVLRWLKLAKTEKTRTARIQQLAELSGKGEKLKGN